MNWAALGMLDQRRPDCRASLRIPSLPRAAWPHGINAIRGRILLVMLLLAGLAYPALAQAQAGAADQVPAYELIQRVNIGQGFLKEAGWLDQDHYLALLLNPDNALVLRTSLADSARETFMSAKFFADHICQGSQSKRLAWTISPGCNYIFYTWFEDDGTHRWQLVDISQAPSFRLRNFDPPAGMQISQVLFSPDDRYAVFVHDAYAHTSSDVSLLVLDLQEGNEYWRVANQDISFISTIWWGGANFDTPRFHVVAGMQNGQFVTPPRHFICDLKQRSVTPQAEDASVITGAEALWGTVTCEAAAEGSAEPFTLVAQVAGREAPVRIPLSASPVKVTALPDPGLVLLSNRAEMGVSQLWLLDVLHGDKWKIDDDCADYSVASDGKVLVRARTKMEIRIYELARPG